MVYPGHQTIKIEKVTVFFFSYVANGTSYTIDQDVYVPVCNHIKQQIQYQRDGNMS